MAQQIQHPKLQMQHPKLQLQHRKLQLQHPQHQLQHPQLQMQHPHLQLQQPQLQLQHPHLQLQQPQLQLRAPTMSLIPAKQFLGQGIPIEHRQRLQQNQYIQHPYYYERQTQPVVEVLYNPTTWFQQQDQLHQQYHQPNNQYWYGMPPVNHRKVLYPKSAAPGIITPSLNHHQTGAQKQTTTKARSRPAHKHQAQSSATQGRSIAGDRSFCIKKTSADCCLNRIRSVSSIQNNKGSRNQGSEHSKNNNELKAVPSMELIKRQEKIYQKETQEKQTDKEVVEELNIAKEGELSLDNGTNSFFRKLSHSLRLRSTKKPKNKKNENGFNNIVTQASSSCSSAKKNGLFSRLFGGVDGLQQPSSIPPRMPIAESH